MQTNELLNTVLKELDSLKAINITSLNVKQLTTLTDYMVIVSGNSSRHVGAIAHNLVHKLKEEGMPPRGIEGDANNEWVLVDCGDIVVHVMQPDTREFYQLEKLWSSHVKEPELETV